jgi:hypothetical protein
VRILFGTQSDYAAFGSAVLEHRDEVTSVLAIRRTQTNEPGRCAARERPKVIRANLLDALTALASEAPADATLVVFHTAVLAYLSARERERFVNDVKALGAEWISNEGAEVVPDTHTPNATPVADSYFVIAQNGQPVAFCDPHGRWVQWL